MAVLVVHVAAGRLVEDRRPSAAVAADFGLERLEDVHALSHLSRRVACAVACRTDAVEHLGLVARRGTAPRRRGACVAARRRGHGRTRRTAGRRRCCPASRWPRRSGSPRVGQSRRASGRPARGRARPASTATCQTKSVPGSSGRSKPVTKPRTSPSRTGDHGGRGEVPAPQEIAVGGIEVEGLRIAGDAPQSRPSSSRGGSNSSSMVMDAGVRPGWTYWRHGLRTYLIRNRALSLRFGRCV